MADLTAIRIPDSLAGRRSIGSGPSKVRPEAVEALRAVADTYLGTSHRQRTVRDQVARLRDGIAALYQLPEGYGWCSATVAPPRSGRSRYSD